MDLGARQSQPVSRDNRAFVRFLIQSLGCLAYETVLGVYTDLEGLYLGHHTVTDGDSQRAPLDHECITRSALGLGARGFLLAHNHPNGNPFPSRADIAATEWLETRLARARIDIIDHLIVAGTTVFSMRQAGYVGR